MFDPQRHAVIWMLVAFVLTTAATRAVTRFIRHKADRAEQYLKENASPGVIRNMVIAGIHVHHQVWGILILLFTGLLMIAYDPGAGVALNCLGFSFGVGAALTLDEFAMWLHLEDVYWKEEGRTSISALMVAVTITAAMAIGADPLNVVPSGSELLSGTLLAAIAVINGGFVIGTILKGKLNLGLMGIFIPFLAMIGFTRLAKPRSWWARRYYAPGSAKDRRSRERFGAAYEARWNAIRDLIGGPPSKPKPMMSLLGTRPTGGSFRVTPAVADPPSEQHGEFEPAGNGRSRDARAQLRTQLKRERLRQRRGLTHRTPVK